MPMPLAGADAPIPARAPSPATDDCHPPDVGPAPLVIDDPDDPAAVRFRLRDRQLAPTIPDPGAPDGLFVAEGDLIVTRALDAGYRLDGVLADDRRGPELLGRTGLGARFGTAALLLAGPAVRERLTGYGVQLDIIALFHRRPMLPVAELGDRARRIVVAEAVDNPANLGAIVRSAVAFSWDALLVDRTGADPYARRCVRASMGWSVTLPTARTAALADDLASLRVRGVRVIGLSPDPTAPALSDVVPPREARVALLLGSERAGISDAARAHCDVVARIPMATGVDSLNVAVAAGVALYELG